MHKGDFYGLILEAWRTTFTKKNISKAFEATELFPFEHNVVIKKIVARRPKSRYRSRSLSSSSYRYIDRLLKQAVPNRHDSIAERLRQAIHEITTPFESIRIRIRSISWLRMQMRTKLPSFVIIRIIRCFYRGASDLCASLSSITRLIVSAFKEYRRTPNKSRPRLKSLSTATSEAGTAR